MVVAVLSRSFVHTAPPEKGFFRLKIRRSCTVASAASVMAIFRSFFFFTRARAHTPFVSNAHAAGKAHLCRVRPVHSCECLTVLCVLACGLSDPTTRGAFSLFTCKSAPSTHKKSAFLLSLSATRKGISLLSPYSKLIFRVRGARLQVRGFNAGNGFGGA